MSVRPCEEPACDDVAAAAIELVLEERPRDLGGFVVGRVLPAPARAP